MKEFSSVLWCCIKSHLFSLPHFRAAMRFVDDGGRLPRGRGLGQWAGRGWMEKREKGGEAAGCARGHIVGAGISGLHHGFWCKIFVTIRIYLFYMRTENPRVGSSILSLGTRNFKGLGLCLTPFFCTKLHQARHGLGSTPLAARSDVRIGRGCGLNGGMPHLSCDRGKVSSGRQHLRCRSVANVIGADIASCIACLFLRPFPCRSVVEHTPSFIMTYPGNSCRAILFKAAPGFFPILRWRDDSLDSSAFSLGVLDITVAPVEG